MNPDSLDPEWPFAPRKAKGRPKVSEQDPTALTPRPAWPFPTDAIQKKHEATMRAKPTEPTPQDLWPFAPKSHSEALADRVEMLERQVEHLRRLVFANLK